MRFYNSKFGTFPIWGLVALTSLWLSASQAPAQAVYDFEDGTDQGWGTGFGDDASKSFPIVTIGGSKRMEVALGGFQVAGRQTGNPADPEYQVLLAASANESLATLSYDWYIDTSLSPGAYGSYLQLGTFINTGSGYYFQDFPGAGKEVELNGAQLASGSVFSGTVSFNLASKGYNIPLGETFFRVGLIMNGDGTAPPKAYYDNIRLTLVPEPVSLVLLGVGSFGLVITANRRRRAK